MRTLSFHCKPFDALSTTELYAILELRIAVFVVEQNCPYQEADARDALAHHFWMTNENNEIVGYARFFAPGVLDEQAHFGRFLTNGKYRKSGFGKQLITALLAEMEHRFGNVAIHISAQLYLKQFYAYYGFVAVGEVYLEDDIPHIAMIKAPQPLIKK